MLAAWGYELLDNRTAWRPVAAGKSSLLLQEEIVAEDRERARHAQREPAPQTQIKAKRYFDPGVPPQQVGGQWVGLGTRRGKVVGAGAGSVFGTDGEEC